MPSEGAFERYRRANSVSNNCVKKKTSYFIEHHLSSTEIYVERTKETLPAVLVVNDSEGIDSFLTFVYENEDIQLGDYFTWKENNHFFVLEKVHIIKEVDYKKFRALECNAITSEGHWIAFKGNMKSYRNTSLKGQVELTSLQPIVIAPISANLQINKTFTVNNQQWKVIDADLSSINGIGYYYVQRDLNPRDLEAEEDALIDSGELDSNNTIYVGEKLTFNSERGYVISAMPIQILSRTATTVEVAAKQPGPLTITVRQNGIDKSYNYEVKEVL
jgi:hypothetical protein